MFDGDLFHSWSHIFAGAIIFAALFGVAVAMGEALFEGATTLTRGVVGVCAGAFVGYIGVALIVRYEG